MDWGTRPKIVIRTNLSSSGRLGDTRATPATSLTQPAQQPHFSPSLPNTLTALEESRNSLSSAPERKILPLPSRLRISSNASTISLSAGPEPLVKPNRLPFLTMPPPNPKSQYAEEYEKCPCKKYCAKGRPPCHRCQFMLLSDRFSELVDVQCQKWGTSPKCNVRKTMTNA